MVSDTIQSNTTQYNTSGLQGILTSAASNKCGLVSFVNDINTCTTDKNNDKDNEEQSDRDLPGTAQGGNSEFVGYTCMANCDGTSSGGSAAQKYGHEFNDYTTNIDGQGGLQETKACIDWSMITQNQKVNPSSHSECVNLDNGYPYGSGCCRAYWWLIMDSGTLYPQLPCICNQFTRDPASFAAMVPGLSTNQWWTTPFPTPGPGTDAIPPTLVPAPVVTGNVTAPPVLVGNDTVVPTEPTAMIPALPGTDVTLTSRVEEIFP
jgi:hypothetical protein